MPPVKKGETSPALPLIKLSDLAADQPQQSSVPLAESIEGTPSTG